MRAYTKDVNAMMVRNYKLMLHRAVVHRGQQGPPPLAHPVDRAGPEGHRESDADAPAARGLADQRDHPGWAATRRVVVWPPSRSSRARTSSTVRASRGQLFLVVVSRAASRRNSSALATGRRHVPFIDRAYSVAIWRGVTNALSSTSVLRRGSVTAQGHETIDSQPGPSFAAGGRTPVFTPQVACPLRLMGKRARRPTPNALPPGGRVVMLGAMGSVSVTLLGGFSASVDRGRSPRGRGG